MAGAGEAACAEGRAAFARGDAAGALRAFRAAQAAGGGAGGQPGALPSNISACLLRLGRAEDALQAAEECVELEPGWVKGHYRKGEALAAMGRRGAAERAFREALEICPGDAVLLSRLEEQQRLLKTGTGLGGHGPAAPESGPRFGLETGGSGGDNDYRESEGARGLILTLEAAVAALEEASVPSVGSGGRELAEAAREFLGGRESEMDLVFAREQLRERIRLLKLQDRASGGRGIGDAAPVPLVQAPPEKPVSALRKARLMREGRLSRACPPTTLPAPPCRGGSGGEELGAERQWTKKRCRMCGNITHKSMKTCTSCYCPLHEPKAFDPCFDAPVVGGATTTFSGARPRPIAAQSGQDATGPSDAFYTAVPSPDKGPGHLPDASNLQPPLPGLGLARGLAVHYAALGLPLGSGQSEVRRAYLELLWEEHPEAGGETEAFRRITDAYDAIATHFRERSQAAFVRSLPLAGLPEGSIFVTMVCYRDPDGIGTLRDLFKKADDPKRIFVGVVWQYASRKRTSVTRLFPGVNVLTGRIESEIAKMAKAGAEEGDMQDYAHKCMVSQMDAQELEQDEEQKAHTRQALPEKLRGRVREVHLDLEGAEGSGYLRHLGEGLYAGEEYLLTIDAGTRFETSWDTKLVEELASCPASQPILTGAPLGVRIGDLGDSSGGDMGRKVVMPSDRRPVVPIAAGFDRRGILRVGAQQLASRGPLEEPPPALFYSSSFAFCRAAGFFRDAPADPHAPCLAFGADVATSARLFTRGWNFFAPREPLVFKNYHMPSLEQRCLSEDWRAGGRLYAGEEEAAGSPGKILRLEFYARTSARRVRQLLGPDMRDAWDVPLGPYGVGERRSLSDFQQFVGVHFHSYGDDGTPGEILERGSLGGLPPGTLALERKGGLLPDFRPGHPFLNGGAYA